jgi:hypothetical protein
MSGRNPEVDAGLARHARFSEAVVRAWCDWKDG